ncbi:uncharacterized protein LOC120420239 [Culex pipiens pallens]|uniref:uncharacterized protein LOC120420239 n=1 Tax=Culex pipiens pallens TaxID=42434 RepID=UPI0019539FC8|nr:uncharacterized protein LOC120420239 [Culex pipiens pallens]
MTSVVAQQFDLPPELWSQIFAHLKPQQLLRIRLVCHRWKAIADRERSLWTRLRIKFTDEVVTLDENFRPFIAPAAEVQLEAVRIVTVDSWWPTHLTCVRMRGCHVSLESFLGMLRRTPNLTQLGLLFVEFASGGNGGVVDFRLERLESLELIQYSDDLLDLFGRLCPRLRELSLEDDGEHDRATARLIESVQDTLQRLKLWMTPYVLQKMSLMERLQLKSVELTDLQEDEYALSLSRFQPSLEELLVTIRRNSVLCEIGTNLPGLKRLTVGLVDEDGLDFLATMPLLEELNIGGGQEALNFNGFHCPNLTALTLDGVELVASSLRSISSKLKELKFEKCAMDSWSDLLAVLAAQSSLLHLDLWFVQFENRAIPAVSPPPQTNLQYLRIYPATPFTNKMLLHLAEMTPHLETLALTSMPRVGDATVRKLCRQLPRLARLTLDFCSVTAACARDVVNRHRALEHVQVRAKSQSKFQEIRRFPS